MITNIIYKEFTEMTISERTFSRKNAESTIFPYNVILCNSYNTGKSALPDIYARRPRARSARGRVRIYQAKHECLCYN